MKAIATLCALTLCASCTSLAAPGAQLASADMREGAALARTYYYTRCGGQNVSPELHWSGLRRANTYALTLIDRSVRPNNWSHWVVVNIPGNVHGLPRGAQPPAGASVVASNFGDLAYAGPCPPAGTGVHHYDFTIYAFAGRAPPVSPDANARELATMLSAASIAHATLSVTAEAGPP